MYILVYMESEDGHESAEERDAERLKNIISIIIAVRITIIIIISIVIIIIIISSSSIITTALIMRITITTTETVSPGADADLVGWLRIDSRRSSSFNMASKNVRILCGAQF